MTIKVLAESAKDKGRLLNQMSSDCSTNWDMTIFASGLRRPARTSRSKRSIERPRLPFSARLACCHGRSAPMN